jgi:hypothetical protein
MVNTAKDYAQHLAETAGEEGHTADAFIKAFVTALRRKEGWPALHNHPRISDLLYAWIDLLRSDEHITCDAEILALLDKVYGHEHENRFWSIVSARWQDQLTSKLVERLALGHPDHDTRVAGVACFAKNEVASFTLLIDSLFRRQPSRSVEFFLDLRSAQDERGQAETTQAMYWSASVRSCPQRGWNICVIWKVRAPSSGTSVVECF